MIIRFGNEYVQKQLLHQLSNLFLIDCVEKDLIDKYFDLVIERVDKCFSASKNKYYKKKTENGVETFFDPIHSCQWFIFLYYYANTVYKSEGDNPLAKKLCDEIYSLSKMVSGADLFYEVEMPDEFMCDHPVGTVIGRANYKNGFTFSQGNTVGNNHGIYPTIGKNVVMLSNSKILGNCNIGDNVVVAANTYIKDEDIPDNSIVFGVSPNLIIKENKYI